MKTKRIILITLGVVGVALLCYLAYRLNYMWDRGMSELAKWDIGYSLWDTYIANITITMAIVLCATCGLAVLDCIFCLEEKKYNKSMLGIAITMMVLFVVFVTPSLVYNIKLISGTIIEMDPYDNFLFFVLEIFITMPFVGLAIAYWAVKLKFILSTAAQSSIQKIEK